MKKIFHILIYVVSTLLAICSILSIFSNTEHHYLKLLNFPRIQMFIASIICLAIVSVSVKKWRWFNFLVLIALFCGILINGSYLINYTGLVSEEVPSATNVKSADAQISILLSNVEMSNRTSAPLINLIETKKPDLVLLMEVDKWWNEQFKILEKQYPYSQQTINNDTYGMVLFSKFPIASLKVNHLQNKNVPSFETTLVLANGKKIRFHAVHPVPPTYFEDLPDNKGQDETALKQVGRKVKNDKLPTIIAGDLNDVVWSHVDELTGTKNILFDVRVGRGFYNSFNAKNILMRWPLDHVFVTKEFRVKSLESLPKIGSDHFPIYVELAFSPD